MSGAAAAAAAVVARPLVSARRTIYDRLFESAVAFSARALALT